MTTTVDLEMVMLMLKTVGENHKSSISSAASWSQSAFTQLLVNPYKKAVLDAHKEGELDMLETLQRVPRTTVQNAAHTLCRDRKTNEIIKKFRDLFNDYRLGTETIERHGD